MEAGSQTEEAEKLMYRIYLRKQEDMRLRNQAPAELVEGSNKTKAIKRARQRVREIRPVPKTKVSEWILYRHYLQDGEGEVWVVAQNLLNDPYEKRRLLREFSSVPEENFTPEYWRAFWNWYFQEQKEAWEKALQYGLVTIVPKTVR